MTFATPLPLPLDELAQQQRRELLELWLDQSRAVDHARRLEAAAPIPLADLIARAADPATLAAELARIEIVPVLTSHPSEMRPAMVLAALAESDTAEAALANLRDVPFRVNLERPTVAHEVETLLGHFTRVIFDAIPDFYEELEEAARQRFGREAPSIPTLLRFHSWVGCDRDGNPECTASATLASAILLHRCVIERYRDDLATLAQESEATAAQEFVRLRDSLEIVDNVATISTEEFAAGLQRLQTFEHTTAVARGLARLMRRYATFGFHVATLEWRQHSDFILFTFDERAHALRPDQRRMSELETQHRIARIRESFHDGATLTDYEQQLSSPKAVELMQSLRALAQIRQRYGAEAVGELIISNCEDVPVVLALQRLAQDAGVFACGEIPVVPLFESLSALEHGPGIITTLLAEPHVREKIARLGDRFEIMVGYSDAAKDGGRIAADMLIKDAQRALVSACAAHGITPRIFHGRGGSFGRGYASFAEAFEPIDYRLPAGTIKITEQGETVANRYGHRAFAAHTIRAWFREALLSARRSDEHLYAKDNENLDALEYRVAQRGTLTFRALRESSSFMESVRALTQLDLIRGFPLSSRPASREEGRHTKIDLASLRAVPFNIAFNLAFAQIPAWFGTGSALEEEIHRSGTSQLQYAYRHRPVFRAAIDRARAALEATNLCIMQGHSEAQFQRDFLADISAEEARARHAVGAITGERPAECMLPVEHAHIVKLTRFLATQRDGSDLYASYLALATIAATVGMTG